MTVPYTFGTESSPIPLSQLDANFATPIAYANTAGNVANAAQPNITSVGTLISLSVAGNAVSGNVNTAGSISAAGNTTTGNISTGGTISAYGSVTGGNLITPGSLSATGNAVVGNLTIAGALGLGLSASVAGNVQAGGNITATGNISAQGNVSAQGRISATGNIVTAGLFVGNFQGNVTGNLAVNGSNTQVLFNNNGNVGAAGGLTYNSGSNTLGILGIVSAQGNVSGNNITAAGKIVVNGTTQLIGLATAPTAPTNTANNQVATTAFVNNQLTAFQSASLGTMSSQNANSVAITGGAVGNLTSVGLSGGWSITPTGNTLYFKFGSSNVAKLDSSGNFTTIGNITGSGTL